MIQKYFLLLFLLINTSVVFTQTTDLAVVVEAQDLNGNGISQVHIYEEFQYVITIINSGNATTNATFSQILNQNVTVISYVSQNNSGGASDVNDFNFSGTTLTGLIQTMPNTSSVQVKVIVKAPQTLGGIATTVSAQPSPNTQDVNPSNNQSIISIDVVDVVIDFTVIHSQISPSQGTAIAAWNDDVTYEFTIRNNSSIAYPLSSFTGNLELATLVDYGRPVVQLQTITCLGGTNGIECPDVSGVAGTSVVVSSSQFIFSYDTPLTFPSNSSLTFRMTYTYKNPRCGIEQLPINVNSFISIGLAHSNASPNVSNNVLTNLLIAELCDLTDVCIETVQIDPTIGPLINWNQQVTFETTVCNNGPLDSPVRFYLQNLSTGIAWDIVSLECIGTTGNISCDDFVLNDNGQFWNTSDFVVPVGTTITIRTVLVFLEPGCSSSTNNNSGHVRSGINVLLTTLTDIDLNNNFDSDYVTLPPGQPCQSSDLSISKTQIIPIPPEGSSAQNTINWGPVTYEITVVNHGAFDTEIEMSDYIPQDANPLVEGTLISVECVATTGTATCFALNHTNIGVAMDSIVENGILDTFWEIIPDDHWTLPAQSSVTFQAVINWSPECSASAVAATNSVKVNHANVGLTDPNNSNNRASVVTYFAPCVDLVVQTFPEFTAVFVNQSFDWIIDISNSATSSKAVNIDLESVMDSNFTIVGSPTCQLINGTAICATVFNVSGTSIYATIPEMNASSTIRIRIPVIAPNFGGAFNNTAQAFPSGDQNEELTPETNISISNVQVIAPNLTKIFIPDEIYLGEESTLTFTLSNFASNPSQSSISFIDVLPDGLTLTAAPIWENSNGCTTTFIGVSGDDFVGVENLIFPQGVANCSFSVTVTSNTIGLFINETSNFIDQNNIDTSQIYATLNAILDSSDVDIEVLKSVSPEEANLGDEVEFTITITNLGTTKATNIVIFESLPASYQFLNATTTQGSYDLNLNTWTVPILNPNESETLKITAKIISSNNLMNIALLQSLTEPDRDPTNNEAIAGVTLGNCLQIPQGFSPTMDGFNDVFVIPCIEYYPNNRLKIFNRLGVQVYESANYKNDWDGIPNMGFPKSTQRLPVGTYYYILETESLLKPLIGWLYLNY